MSDSGVEITIVMTDYATPILSQLVVDWMSLMPVDQQIEHLKLIGIEPHRREEYLSALAGKPVVVTPTTPRALESGIIDISATMAIEGAPGQKRPQPQVGARQPKVVESKKLS